MLHCTASSTSIPFQLQSDDPSIFALQSSSDFTSMFSISGDKVSNYPPPSSSLLWASCSSPEVKIFLLSHLKFCSQSFLVFSFFSLLLLNLHLFFLSSFLASFLAICFQISARSVSLRRVSPPTSSFFSQSLVFPRSCGPKAEAQYPHALQEKNTQRHFEQSRQSQNFSENGYCLSQNGSGDRRLNVSLGPQPCDSLRPGPMGSKVRDPTKRTNLLCARACWGSAHTRIH